MDFLRHSIAPVTDLAWEHLAAEARRVLTANLSARRFVDVQGPRGFEHAAVNLGKLGSVEQESEDGIKFGVRQVLPLVEVRVPFRLDLWALDDLSRGAAQVDTDALTEACTKLARFEDRAVYLGFSHTAAFEESPPRRRTKRFGSMRTPRAIPMPSRGRSWS